MLSRTILASQIFRKVLCIFLLSIVSLFFGVFSISGSVFAGPNINYWELFPNGSSVYQSQTNGWTTPNPYSIKDIVTPEGCKRIVTGNLVGKSFIPTRSLAEWSFFKAYLPSGVSIIECPVDGVCGGGNNSCATGNPIGYYSPGSCGGTNTWTCAGLYGGNSTSCSTPNTPCPINGGWSGWQYWYTDNQGCDRYTYTYYIRYCNNPTPQYGGSNCVGSNTTYTSYYNGPCCASNMGQSCATTGTWVGYSQYKFKYNPPNQQWCDRDINGNYWPSYSMNWYNCPNTNPETYCTVSCSAYPARGTVQCDGGCGNVQAVIY